MKIKKIRKIFEKDDRVVLVPGNCPQNNYKDAPDCYFNLAIIDKESVKLEKTSIHTWSPNTYHKFLFVNDVKEIKDVNETTHYRIKSFSNSKKRKKEELSSNILDINKVFEDFITSKDVENKEEIRSLFFKYFSEKNVKNDYYIPNVEINKLKVFNFLSIDSLELDIKSLPDQVVIIGDTGSGKTSALESIYFALTGSTTKNISVDNLINKNSEEKDLFYVELEFNVNEKHYKIKRGRNNGKPELFFYSQTDNGEFLPFNKISVKETQDYIYKLLNFNDFDIKLFSYYASKNPILFNTLKDSEKFSVISKILRLFDLDEIRETVKVDKNNINSSLLELSGELRVLNSNLQSVDSKILSYNPSNISELEKQLLDSLEELKNKKAELSFLDSQSSSIDSIRKTSDALSTEIRELEKTIQFKTHRKNSLSSELMRHKEDYNKLCKTGKCYTCNQEIKNEDLKRSLEDKVKILASEIITINYDQESNKLKESSESYNNYSKVLRDYFDAQSRLITLNKEEELINNKLKSFVSSDGYLDNLKIDRDEIIKNLEDKNNKNKSLQDELNCYNFLLNNILKKDGDFIKELNMSIVKIIQCEIDDLLEDKELTIKIDKDLNVVSNFNGESLNYENLSNGQSRICDLILLIGLNNVFSKLYNINGILGISMFDETLSFLSPNYIDIAKSLLDKLICNKLFVITHDNRLTSYFDGKIIVNMNKGISSYEILN